MSRDKCGVLSVLVEVIISICFALCVVFLKNNRLCSASDLQFQPSPCSCSRAKSNHAIIYTNGHPMTRPVGLFRISSAGWSTTCLILNMYDFGYHNDPWLTDTVEYLEQYLQ